jgi:MoxR-like ATPase
MTETILQPEEINPAVELANRALAELDRILLGRSELHRLVLAGVLSRGHILLEGLPGVGKTALVKALGGLLNLQFNRVQFTPDLMPSDILGAHILQENHDGRRAMEFHPGPIFTNLLLADEINRASPKTQSALLEAMQERAVTLLGSTRPLPDPFFVLASQNPIELEGTYPLPEAQLDRFLFKLNVTGADVETLDRIISTRRRGEPPAPDFVMSGEETASFCRSPCRATSRAWWPRRTPIRMKRLTTCALTSLTALRRAPRSPWPKPRGLTPCSRAARPSALTT